MSDLPIEIEQAAAKFQDPLVLQDPASRQHIIDWGYQHIELEYPLDPVRAPLNLLRRKRAYMAWEKAIRTNGAEYRDKVAGASLDELGFQLQRRRDDILAADQLAQQQKGMLFAQDVQIKTHEMTTDIDFGDWKRRSQLEQQWQETNAEAESKRRINEQIATTEQEIIRLGAAAMVESMTNSSSADILEIVRDVNRDIENIRNDATISDDGKHLQIKTLLEALPLMLQKAQRGG